MKLYSISTDDIYSGLARVAARSARPTFARTSIPSLANKAAPAFAAPLQQRWASAEVSAKDGKIHQVIGAVVDGTKTSSRDPNPAPE